MNAEFWLLLALLFVIVFVGTVLMGRIIEMMGHDADRASAPAVDDLDEAVDEAPQEVLRLGGRFHRYQLTRKARDILFPDVGLAVVDGHRNDGAELLTERAEGFERDGLWCHRQPPGLRSSVHVSSGKDGSVA